MLLIDVCRHEAVWDGETEVRISKLVRRFKMASMITCPHAANGGSIYVWRI